MKEPSQKEETEFQRTSQLVSNWYQSYYLWNIAMTSQVYDQKLTHMRPMALNVANDSTQRRLSSTNRAHRQANQQVQNLNQQQNYVQTIYRVPSLARRFAAECFDALYIQCFKIALALLIVNYTDLISEDSLNIYDFLDDILNEDNLNNIRLPLELLIFEIMYVSISVLFESYCLYVKGCTPGKYLMNLRIVSCTEINELLTPNHIRVNPGGQLSIKSIFVRTCLKNFSIIFLFPTIVFFLLPVFVENGQTTYDKIAETIVVENISD